MVFTVCYDSKNRPCIKLGRRILARWRNDMPGQTRYQFVREKKAVENGFGELCYTAIQSVAYCFGLTDFSPAVYCPEFGYIVVFKENVEL